MDGVEDPTRESVGRGGGGGTGGARGVLSTDEVFLGLLAFIAATDMPSACINCHPHLLLNISVYGGLLI